MEIEFAFRREQSGIFGPILRPVARVIFINGRNKIPEILYVDSGADITLIPRSVGDLLGLKLSKTEEIQEIKGVGERGVPIVVRNIKIQIGSKIIPARISWALIEDVPMLLGRIDVFKLFDITFSKNSKTIFAN